MYSEAICKLGLKAKILTHTRCTMSDARIAVETGVDGNYPSEFSFPIFITNSNFNKLKGSNGCLLLVDLPTCHAHQL